jgi:hypothetical protein
MSRPEVRPDPRYGRYIGLLVLLILVLVTISVISSKPSGGTGIEPGHRLPPFAVPLALGSLTGDANVATPADVSATTGRVPACSVRGPEVLNVCQLYEHAPLVLALFIDSGSCPAILGDMQSLQSSFPGVRFAGVALQGKRDQVRRLIRKRGLTLPIGIDSDGALAALYKVATCPQLTFALPGGVAQGRALFSRPARATLRARVSELVAAARARGWKGAGA